MELRKIEQGKVKMTDKIRLTALKVVIMLQLIIEEFDVLRGTMLFNGKVKTLLRNLSNLLMPMLHKEYTRVYNENPEMATNILREVDELVTKIATSDINDLVMLNQIRKHYVENKEDWKEKFAVEFTRLNT